MKALREDYTGCAILIYDEHGSPLGSTLVTSHDKSTMRIKVQEIPSGFKKGSERAMLILTSPAPCEYQGRLLHEGKEKVIAIYKGRVRENRGAKRFKVNSPAIIENLICDGKAYKLHTPLEVELINISKSGARFRAPNYALSDGSRFQLRIKISKSEKLLIADAIYHVDRDDGTSEYGSRFLIGSESAV